MKLSIPDIILLVLFLGFVPMVSFFDGQPPILLTVSLLILCVACLTIKAFQNKKLGVSNKHIYIPIAIGVILFIATTLIF